MLSRSQHNQSRVSVSGEIPGVAVLPLNCVGGLCFDDLGYQAIRLRKGRAALFEERVLALLGENSGLLEAVARALIKVNLANVVKLSWRPTTARAPFTRSRSSSEDWRSEQGVAWSCLIPGDVAYARVKVKVLRPAVLCGYIVRTCG